LFISVVHLETESGTMPNNNLAVAVDVAQLELSGLIGGSRIFLGGAQGRVHPDVY